MGTIKTTRLGGGVLAERPPRGASEVAAPAAVVDTCLKHRPAGADNRRVRRRFVLIPLLLMFVGLAACRPATTPAAAPSSQAPAAPTVPVSAGAYRVVGTRIVDTTGKTFVPIGANVGTVANFDWKGIADGHSADAVAWGWNTVRLNVVFAPLYAPTATTLAHVQRVIDEYTAKGIVVIVASHDTLDSPTQSIVRSSFATLAVNNRSNSRVWFNGINEPALSGAAWVAFQRNFVQLIRDQGNASIVVADAVDDANDGSWIPAPHLDDPAGPPAILAGNTNVLFATHNYGGHDSIASMSAYVDAVRANGAALLVGEFGYRLPPNEDAWNKSAALANMAVYKSKGVGILVWHATHGDGYSLMANGGPFYEGSGGSGLSDLGTRFWALTH